MAYDKKAEKKGTPPLKHFRSGLLSVSVWENETKDGKGKYLSYSLQRSYPDPEREGEYKNTESYRRQDLLPLARLLGTAFDGTTLKSKGADEE